jgi:hypothetical protein
MPRRRPVPPPERVTWADYFRIGLGVLMIPLGITILVRTLSAGILTPASVLIALAFIGFGLYRLYLGIVRYRIYRATKGRK